MHPTCLKPFQLSMHQISLAWKTQHACFKSCKPTSLQQLMGMKSLDGTKNLHDATLCIWPDSGTLKHIHAYHDMRLNILLSCRDWLLMVPYIMQAHMQGWPLLQDMHRTMEHPACTTRSMHPFLWQGKPCNSPMNQSTTQSQPDTVTAETSKQNHCILSTVNFNVHATGHLALQRPEFASRPRCYHQMIVP